MYSCSKFVNSRDIIEVFTYLGENFDPQKDLTLHSNYPLDTLDFTSGKMNIGSKVGFNCIGEGKELSADAFKVPKIDDPRKKINFISDYRVMNKNIIIIKININKNKAISEIKIDDLLKEFKFIFIVSEMLKFLQMWNCYGEFLQGLIHQLTCILKI